MKLTIKNITMTTSAVLFVAALTQPAFRVGTGEDGWWSAIMALLTGWMGAAMLGAGISWLANPLLVLGWCLVFKNPKIALWFGAIATAFAAGFLLFDEVMVNEAGGKGPILGYGPGYWLWLLSCVCFTTGTAIVCFGNKKQLKNG